MTQEQGGRQRTAGRRVARGRGLRGAVRGVGVMLVATSLTACGGGGGAAPTGSTAATAPTPSPTATAPAPASGGWTDAQATVSGEPLVAIPGFGGQPGGLVDLVGEHPDRPTVVMDIGDGTGDLRYYGALVVATARGLAAQSPTGRVDLVGFSAGGITARLAVQQEPDLFSQVVTLGSPHAGTEVFDEAAARAKATPAQAARLCTLACQQMRTGSDLLRGLPPVNDPVRWLSVLSTTDTVIQPVTSAALPGSTVVRIQDRCGPAGVAHSAVPRHPLVHRLVAAFIDGAPLPSGCPSR